MLLTLILIGVPGGPVAYTYYIKVVTYYHQAIMHIVLFKTYRILNFQIG